VRIEGTDTDTGTDRVVEGPLSEVIVTGDGDVAAESIASYGGRVALVVETDDGPVEVGGWGQWSRPSRPTGSRSRRRVTFTEATLVVACRSKKGSELALSRASDRVTYPASA